MSKVKHPNHLLLVVGTGHHYQFGAGVHFGDDCCTEECEVAFTKMLRELTVAHGIRLLAEELNQQALEEVDKNTSVVQAIAAELSIPHLFCDPDRQERYDLGIKTENDIRISAFPKTLPEDVVQTLCAESWRRRELEWLRRLDAVKSKVVLFVCGANHVPTFVPMALAQGIAIKVAHTAWEV